MIWQAAVIKKATGFPTPVAFTLAAMLALALWTYFRASDNSIVLLAI